MTRHPVAEIRALSCLDSRNPGGLVQHYLAIIGRMDEAMTQIDRKVSLDPFNASTHAFRAMVLGFTDRYDEAITEARKALAIAPRNPPALSALLMAQAAKGMDQDALATMKEYVKVYLPNADALMDEGFAAGGFTEAMRRAGNAFGRQVAAGGPGSPADVSWPYLCADDKSRALDWLEKGYDLRDPNMVYIGVMPIYDAIRAEPRFRALVEKMRLPVG
jgi:tetratricopeptide (TPR) repeat protein